MTQHLKRIGIATAVIFGASVLAPAVFAQAPAQRQAPTQQQTSPQTAPQNKPDLGPKPSDSELKHFVHAAMDVQSIAHQAQPKLQSAKDNADRVKIQQAAEKKMEAAVKTHHLSVHRYQQIAMAMQTDQSIRAKVNKLAQEEAQQ